MLCLCVCSWCRSFLGSRRFRCNWLKKVVVFWLRRLCFVVFEYTNSVDPEQCYLSILVKRGEVFRSIQQKKGEVFRKKRGEVFRSILLKVHEKGWGIPKHSTSNQTNWWGIPKLCLEREASEKASCVAFAQAERCASPPPIVAAMARVAANTSRQYLRLLSIRDQKAMKKSRATKAIKKVKPMKPMKATLLFRLVIQKHLWFI